MAFKGDDSTLSLATTVTLAIAVAAMVLTKNPLQSSRPPGTGTGLQQVTGELSIRARLWEDPFGAVERDIHAQKSIALQVVTDGKQFGQVTAMVSQRSQISGDGGLRGLQDKIKRVGVEQVLALVVMTGGGTSVEAVEERIRDRYAIGAALEAGCFAPDKSESLSYFTWSYVNPLQGPSKEKNPLSQYTPYEWYERSGIGTCRETGASQDGLPLRHVLVLWVNAPESDEKILARIHALISIIYAPGSQDPKRFFRVKLVGPRTSSEFRRILKEIKQHPSPQRTGLGKPGYKYIWPTKNGSLPLYSPWATAPPGLLAYGLEYENGGKACGSYDECKRVFKHLLTTAGIDSTYLVTSDEVLFESLMKELHRRQVTIKQDRIVLIGEWDSFYARALPLTFLGAAHQHFENSHKHECQSGGASVRSGEPSPSGQSCISVDEGMRQVFAGESSLRGLNIMQYSYLSGLDGEASDDQAKRAKSKEDNKEKEKDKAEGKGRFRDIDSYERPEGPSQLDYVRRLVARIKAECQDSSQNENQPNGKVKAIGILGRDPYDALLILQAVREQFPNALFFATDLDARYFHEDEQKWTRNLIVVSQFGLQLEPSLQQSIPPFRSSLQTSAFFAALQAIGQVAPQPPDSTIPPRLFEIGRHGAVDLSTDVPRSGEKSVHPVRSDVAGDNKSLKLPPRIGLLWIVGLLLSFLVLWGYGRLWNWLTAWSEPDSTKRPFLWILRRVWVFIPVILALWFWCRIAHFPYAEEEPFSWSDGVSIWPTEALRLFAICLCLFFLIKACADSGRNIDELTQSFFPDVACRPRTSGWRNALKGFGSDLDWMFHGSKQAHPGDGSALWVRYCRAHRCLPRIGRVVLGLVAYLFLVVPLWLFMNDGEFRLPVPCRGVFTCKVDFAATMGSVWLLLILNLAVLDAVILCTRWVQEMPAATKMSEMQQIRLIVERTKIVNRRILYPFLALFLLIAARSHYFDNWDFPPVLILVLAVNTLVALASVSMLYLAAVQAKRRILAPLQQRLDHLAQAARDAGSVKDRDASAEALRQIITDIDGVQQGAFVPFYQQPVVQATLVAALAFLQYWYLGQ